jgi:hypothetical protein
VADVADPRLIVGAALAAALLLAPTAYEWYADRGVGAGGVGDDS